MFFVLLAAVVLAAVTRRLRRVPLWLWLTLLIELVPLLDATGQVRFRSPIDLVFILLTGVAATELRSRQPSVPPDVAPAESAQAA
jgi:hypothetical protein